MGSYKRKIRLVALLTLVCTAVGSVWLAPSSCALTGGFMCGYDEEHTHTEACFKDVLVCGKEEHAPLCGKQEHLHDLSCCKEQRTLICGMPEHIHGTSCYDASGMLICPYVEHTHTDYCYHTEMVLACGRQEHSHTAECVPKDENGNHCEIHVHTSACWQNQCVCGKREHKHDPLLCMFASFEDVENEIVWESTIPFSELNGNWNHDILTVAASQIGYTESYTNTVLAEDGKMRLGYTRYGHWYGYPYGDWCAMFGAFCLSYAGVPKEAVPHAPGVATWMQTLEKRGILESPGLYLPNPGDLVFIADDGVTPNHMGIVSSFTPVNGNGGGAVGGMLQIIQGNKEDAVRVVDIAVPHWSIMGYVDIRAAQERWNGTESVEVRFGDDLLELKYQQKRELEQFRELFSERLFESNEYYSKLIEQVDGYLEDIDVDIENIKIKLYELEALNEAISAVKPDELYFVSGASGTPIITSFDMDGKTYVAICR